MTGARVPLIVSLAGHAAGLAILVWVSARLPPIMPSLPAPTDAIQVVFETPPAAVVPPATATPAKAKPAPPVKQPPPPIVKPPRPPVVAVKPPPPPPVVNPPPTPPVAQVEATPPRPAIKPPPPVVEFRPPPPPRRVARRWEARPMPPPEPVPREALPARAPPTAYRPPLPERQTASLPPEPSRRPAAPTVSAGYSSALASWFESHKHYPEGARDRDEQGEAILRFRVARSGRVLNYAVIRSSGYPDLDAAVDTMMRGAVLPPFPEDMQAPDIEVSVAVRFSLAQ